MTDSATVYRYRPKANTTTTDDPPRTTPAYAPTPAPPVQAEQVVTGSDARAALSSGIKELWMRDPALRGVRAEEQRIGQDFLRPAYSEVADRTGFSKEMRAEARRIGLSRLLTGVWGTTSK